MKKSLGKKLSGFFEKKSLGKKLSGFFEKKSLGKKLSGFFEKKPRQKTLVGCAANSGAGAAFIQAAPRARVTRAPGCHVEIFSSEAYYEISI